MAVVAVVLGVVLAACGGSGSSTTATTTAVSPVSPILKAGLKAQAEGNLTEAIADYNAVLMSDPKNVYALYNLGVIAQDGGSTNEAANDYQKVLAADSSYEPALFNLATIETTVAPKDAAKLYQRIIALQPKNASAHLNLGFVLKGLGQTKQGQAQIDTALKLDPSLGRSGTAATGPGAKGSVTTTTSGRS